MFALDHDLAQDIVARAMAILPCNVNVMDPLGIIIGSGDTERLYTRHEGAQLVLANHRIVEIDQAMARGLDGVRPGVNLPLLLNGQLMGVLGITGEPGEVRVYGELVRMTAEMLLEQRRQQADRQWREQRGEALIARLLFGDAGTGLRDEAERLGLRPELPRQAVLLELADAEQVDLIAAWLNGRYAHGWCVVQGPGRLYWCRVNGRERDDESLLEQLAAQGWQVTRMATAEPTRTLPELRHACAGLGDLLDFARAQRPAQRLLRLEPLCLAALLWRYREDPLARRLATPLARLSDQPPLLDTLQAWFDHGGESQSCAAALGIHRNSLRYRLEKIAELTGCDPYRIDDAMRLYAGLSMSNAS